MSRGRSMPRAARVGKVALSLSHERDDLVDALLVVGTELGISRSRLARERDWDRLAECMCDAVSDLKANQYIPHSPIDCRVVARGSTVRMEVLAMPEKARGLGELARLGHMRLTSEDRPRFDGQVVHLRGLERRHDHDVVTLDFPTREDAKAFVDLVDALVARANIWLRSIGVDR